MESPGAPPRRPSISASDGAAPARAQTRRSLFGSRPRALIATKTSLSLSGRCTRQKRPPVRQSQPAAAQSSPSVQLPSARAAARSGSGGSAPLPTGKKGGLATTRSAEPAQKSSRAARISPQTMSPRPSRAFSFRFSFAAAATEGRSSSPVMTSFSDRASSSSVRMPPPQPRSKPRLAPASGTKSARSTLSVPSGKWPGDA